MHYETYLKSYQKVLYQTFKNALEKNQVSHAYLLVGEEGIPLLPIAQYLAKSLVCDHPTPFACEECFTCLRMEEGNYADFLLLNGKEKTIKKEEIQALETLFEKTAIEEKGKMIYIIHLVENMTVEAVNSLLKFLEEPASNIYAFLTTENELKVLPTIVSRAQRIPLKKIPQEDVIAQAEAQGLTSEDAEILSFYHNDVEIMKEQAQDTLYLQVKQDVLGYLQALAKSKDASIYYIEKEVIPNYKSKEDIRFFLDILVIFLQEILSYQEKSVTYLKSYDSLLESLKELKGVENSLLEAMNVRGKLDLNINPSLILDHIAIKIAKGDSHHE